MNTITARQLVEKFNLSPHPEGGHFKENYRSLETIPKHFFPSDLMVNAATVPPFISCWSKVIFRLSIKIKSDECWHFYAGETLWIYVIHLNGRLEVIKLGNDILKGEQFQAVVPAECWFASEPAPGSAFSFVGCTVAPGFDFGDFELAKEAILLKQFAQHRELISRLCRL